jgi:hypothetical protein
MKFSTLVQLTEIWVVLQKVNKYRHMFQKIFKLSVQTIDE